MTAETIGLGVIKVKFYSLFLQTNCLNGISISIRSKKKILIDVKFHFVLCILDVMLTKYVHKITSQ